MRIALGIYGSELDCLSFQFLVSRVKLKLIMHYCIQRFIACKGIAIAFGNQMCCIKENLVL